MLLVLPLKVLQLVGHVFLETGQIVWLQCTFVIKLLEMQHDFQKSGFASKVILVGRVGDLVGVTIDLDLIFWHTLEDHGTEHGLIEDYRRTLRLSKYLR